MADSEVSIIIKAVDEASKILANVKNEIGGLEKTGKSLAKTQEATTSAFKDSTASLIAIGNAANTVDNIFSSYQNLQNRIENAELRVVESRQSLQEQTFKIKSAQEAYNVAVAKYGKNSDEARKAAATLSQEQLNLETTTRRLQISQNNLERAQNAVVGSYISMGVQTVALIASLPQLAIAVGMLSKAMLGLQLSMGGAAGVIIAIGALIGAVALLIGKKKKAIDISNQYAESLNLNFQPSIIATKDAVALLGQEVDALAAKEREAAREKLASIYAVHIPYLEQTNKSKEAIDLLAITQALLNGKLEITKDNYKLARQVLSEYTGSSIDLMAFLKEKGIPIKQEVIDALKKEIEQQRLLNDELDRELSLRDQLIKQAFESGRATGFTSKAKGRGGQSSDLKLNPSKKKDFIFRPGQKPLSFSPDDTIIGAKGKGLNNLGGGRGINIYIDKVMGIDARDISDALQQKLFTLIPKL